MQWCQKHWDMLREGVRERKMWRFVPESGEEACENAILEVEGHGSTFDPLSGAMWQLTNTVLDNYKKTGAPPEQILGMIGSPDWCPMCDVQASYDSWAGKELPEWAADSQQWIDRKLDGALKYAREQGWKLDGE